MECYLQMSRDESNTLFHLTCVSAGNRFESQPEHRLTWLLLCFYSHSRIRDSGASTSAKLRTERSGAWTPTERSDRLWGPPIFLLNGYRDSFPGIKRPGHEVDHSTLLIAVVNLLLPPHGFMGMRTAFLPFLDGSAKLRKVIISSVMNVRPPVRTEQLGSRQTEFHEIYLSIFRKSV